MPTSFMTSFFDLLRAGGLMMLPLAACSVLAVAIIIERARHFGGLNRSGAVLMEQLRRALDAPDEHGAQTLAARALDSSQGPLPAALRAGWQAHADGDSLDGVEAAMEEAAQAAFLPLRRGLATLDTIVTIAPLLGLLGTIAGMMSTFRGVAAKAAQSVAQADADASLITGGIGEALIATAFGIAIAVVSLVFLNAFNARLEDLVAETELRCTQLLRAFKQQILREASR